MAALLTNKRGVPKALVMVAMVLCVLFAQTPGIAEAKTMKSSGVKFTTPGKTVSTKLWWSGIGTQKYNIKISKPKVKNAKKGYRTATFTVTSTRKWAPTKTQAKKMIVSSSGPGLEDGNAYYFLIDYNTGQNLWNTSTAKKRGITVEATNGPFKNYQTYEASSSDAVALWKTAKWTIKVTYPKSYKNLCVGFGFGQKAYKDAQMAKYDKGNIKYTKSWWHKNNKAGTYFVRIQ